MVSNFLKRTTLPNLTHMMSITDLIVIGVEISKIDSECSLQKEFTKFIGMNS